MILAGRAAKILLIDTNVYFSKRLGDSLKREGFEVTSSTQPAFALTTLEYDPPTAIVCSTNMREMGALDIARMIRADVKNSAMPIIALGDGGQRALMQAFQAGCDDYIDRTRPPAVIATHIRNIIVSKAEGFQPTQMLAQADTSLSGSLTHHDLPSVMQMLGQAHQTGALHINSGDTDALLFFDAGAISHAECGQLFGDEAVIHILKSCFKNNSGVYKFVYGSASPQRTVLRSSTDLMLDAMREVDEAANAEQTSDSAPTPDEIALPSSGASESQDPVADWSETSATAQPSASESEPTPVTTDELAGEQAEIQQPAPAEPTPAQAIVGAEELQDDLSAFPSESDDPISSVDAHVSDAAVGDESSEALESGQFLVAKELDDVPTPNAPGFGSVDLESFHYPPSEGYFFADRQKTPELAPEPTQESAEESSEELRTETVETTDDFAAITDAIDRFANRRSNDFLAASADDDHANVQPARQHPVSDDPASEYTFDSLPDLQQESAAPATPAPDPAAPASDDPSVATRSEEEQ